MNDSKYLIIIDGASGTGKSDFLKFIESDVNSSCILKKYTTRVQRDFEKKENYLLDLNFCTSSEFYDNEFDYVYKYGGYYYGFRRDAVEWAIKNHKYTFIVIRNIELLKRIKFDFSYINTISLYIHSDINEIKVRLSKQHHNEKEIEFRISRIKDTFKDYIQNSTEYDEIIINNSNIDDYKFILNKFLEKYTNC